VLLGCLRSARGARAGILAGAAARSLVRAARPARAVRRCRISRRRWRRARRDGIRGRRARAGRGRARRARVRRRAAGSGRRSASRVRRAACGRARGGRAVGRRSRERIVAPGRRRSHDEARKGDQPCASKLSANGRESRRSSQGRPWAVTVQRVRTSTSCSASAWSRTSVLRDPEPSARKTIHATHETQLFAGTTQRELQKNRKVQDRASDPRRRPRIGELRAYIAHSSTKPGRGPSAGRPSREIGAQRRASWVALPRPARFPWNLPGFRGTCRRSSRTPAVASCQTTGKSRFVRTQAPRTTCKPLEATPAPCNGPPPEGRLAISDAPDSLPGQPNPRSRPRHEERGTQGGRQAAGANRRQV
jgi:hypothetical protein